MSNIQVAAVTILLVMLALLILDPKYYDCESERHSNVSVETCIQQTM